MPLYHYPCWLSEVNSYLARLTNHLLRAEDFDYPWIEAFLKNNEPEQAANEALEADGFIIEKLPTAAMLLKGVNNEPRH